MLKKIIRDQSGNLLITLLVSCSIIALLATISMPYIRQYQPNMKLSATAREMAADLRYAQQLTITEQVTHSVQFDFSNDKYNIRRLTGVATTTIKTVEFDPSVAFQQITGFTDDEVRFNSYGAVSESGDVTLINTNSKTMIINIKPSGYVQVQ